MGRGKSLASYGPFVIGFLLVALFMTQGAPAFLLTGVLGIILGAAVIVRVKMPTANQNWERRRKVLLGARRMIREEKRLWTTPVWPPYWKSTSRRFRAIWTSESARDSYPPTPPGAFPKASSATWWWTCTGASIPEKARISTWTEVAIAPDEEAISTVCRPGPTRSRSP